MVSRVISFDWRISFNIFSKKKSFDTDQAIFEHLKKFHLGKNLLYS